ncbi:uncharacterized protein [Anabrus simplex]|uniref:uncharacterized protein isoform X1 n=1 Tax=Anabrus simplex TaxID=316456 RepID=UPI0034DD9592
MRTKSFILFLVCVVVTTVFLIGFGNQRPSIETIVTETHKQLNNLKTFKEDLYNAQEKRLVADSKYLKRLGFTQHPRLYPHSVWKNTTLPVVITYIFVKVSTKCSQCAMSAGMGWNRPVRLSFILGFDTTKVTEVLDGQEQQAVGFAHNIAHYLPNHTALIYNLGLEHYAYQMLLGHCNSSRCTVVNYDLSVFPSHVEEERLHAFRPLIIQDALWKAGAVLFLECDYRLVTGHIEPLVQAALVTGGGGVTSWPTKFATTSLTHPKMFDYFCTSPDSFLFLPMVESSRILIYNNFGIHRELMLPWVKCALTRDCVYPIGAQSAGCRFNKKPQYRYSGCHRFDGSALNIALGLHFGFDETRYIYQGQETFFRRIGPELAAEELSGLDWNSTDSTITNKDGT